MPWLIGRNLCWAATFGALEPKAGLCSKNRPRTKNLGRPAAPCHTNQTASCSAEAFGDDVIDHAFAGRLVNVSGKESRSAQFPEYPNGMIGTHNIRTLWRCRVDAPKMIKQRDVRQRDAWSRCGPMPKLSLHGPSDRGSRNALSRRPTGRQSGRTAKPRPQPSGILLPNPVDDARQAGPPRKLCSPTLAFENSWGKQHSTGWWPCRPSAMADDNPKEAPGPPPSGDPQPATLHFPPPTRRDRYQQRFACPKSD